MNAGITIEQRYLRTETVNASYIFSGDVRHDIISLKKAPCDFQHNFSQFYLITDVVFFPIPTTASTTEYIHS